MKLALALSLVLPVTLARAQGVVHVVGGSPGDGGFGSSMDGGADLDGDGFPDLVVGAWQGCTGVSASVVSGRNGVVVRRIAAPNPGPVGDPEFGHDVAILGDVDLDGFSDFAVGSPRADSVANPFTDDGAIYVYSGATGAVLKVIVGNGVSGAFIGTNLARCFDVDGDGRADVCTSFGQREVRAYSVVTGQAYPLLTLPFFQFTGGALANVGDTDQDGTEELLTCSGPTTGGLDTAWKLSKSGGASSQSIFDSGTFQQCAISGGFDFNGDGIADYAVGNPWATKPASGGQSQQGFVSVNSGSSGAFTTLAYGQGNYEFLGGALAMLPDVTGDGKADLLVGTRARLGAGACVPQLGQHDSWRLVGIGSGTPFSTYAQYDAAPGTSTGFEVASVGDVNGDGSPEFAVASPTEGHGIVRIWSAKCGGHSVIGSGCSGSGGIVPQVSANGCLTPGGTISLDIANAVGGSIAYFALGLGPGSTALGNGCTLNVAPLAPSLLGPFFLFPIGGTGPGVGFLNIVAEVPIVSPLGGLALQAIVLDPGAAPGFCVTNGVQVTIN